MTRQQRRSKSQWINGLKRRGYTYRRGSIWQRWRWTPQVRLKLMIHPDFWYHIGEIEDGSKT